MVALRILIAAGVMVGNLVGDAAQDVQLLPQIRPVVQVVEVKSRETFLLAQAHLMARVIGWEAPPWAAGDRPYVAAVIIYRMMSRDQSLAEVLFDPYQFEVVLVGKHKQRPPDMELLVPLALEALQWEWHELPLWADAFWSPVHLDTPPHWARPELEILVPGTVHRFYLLTGSWREDC